MAIAYLEALRNARLNLITAQIDAVSAGLIEIYDGSRPATGVAISGQTLLAELVFSATSFPGASSGTMSANAITGDASANNTGTATWFRVTDSTGAFVMDGNVGTSGSDMNLNTTSIQELVAVDITQFDISAGNP